MIKKDTGSEKRAYSVKVGDKQLEVTLNYLAKQADGSVMVRLGDTVVLVTAVMKKSPNDHADFFPLSVEYEENYWAAGKIRGSRFMKRKGKPLDEAILTARLIDRSIRPLFPKGMRNEVQVVATVLSFDRANDPRPLAILGAGIALEISSIPFAGPLAGIHIGTKEKDFVLNPTIQEQEQSSLSIFVTGVRENVAMVEAGANQVPEETVIEALALAQKENTKLSDFIAKITKENGHKKIEPKLFLPIPAIKDEVRQAAYKDLQKICADYPSKHAFEASVAEYKEAFTAKMLEEHPDAEFDIKESLHEIVKEIIRANVLKEKKRLGGRAMDEVRPLAIEISVLPRTHGSAIFNRGETQGLTTATLGAPGSELTMDGMTDEAEAKKHYMHFYSFPPFSTGETAPMRGPGRREIGHGALAEKALVPVIPSKEDFPYTIILHTEIMGSDGSTSMASVCGSTLALMDAGVPIKQPVAGVAMGLIIDKETKKYQVLTDLNANEDFAGHMDFKVAGTKTGITALQMDIKVDGLSLDVLRDALAAARAGRLHIMEKMLAAIKEPRSEMSPYAPRVEKLTVPVDKIREIIGPGGKMINSIIEKTGVQIDIENDGTVFVASENQDSMKRAIDMILGIVKVPEVGEVFMGKVTRILDFGAFVEFLPNQEGLVHVSRLTRDRQTRVSDILKVGDELKVKIIEIDRMGRYNLAPAK